MEMEKAYGTELSSVARLTVEVLVNEENLVRAERALDQFMNEEDDRLLSFRVVASDWLPTDEQADLEELSPGYEENSHDFHKENAWYVHACADCRRDEYRARLFAGKRGSHFPRSLIPQDAS